MSDRGLEKAAERVRARLQKMKKEVRSIRGSITPDQGVIARIRERMKERRERRKARRS